MSTIGVGGHLFSIHSSATTIIAATTAIPPINMANPNSKSNAVAFIRYSPGLNLYSLINLVLQIAHVIPPGGLKFPPCHLIL